VTRTGTLCWPDARLLRLDIGLACDLAPSFEPRNLISRRELSLIFRRP